MLPFLINISTNKITNSFKRLSQKEEAPCALVPHQGGSDPSFDIEQRQMQPINRISS